MKKIKTGSFWLGLFEQLVYIVPTLTTILYYYFSEIQKSVSYSSQLSFGLAVTLFVFFVVYKQFVKTKLKELRQSVVQTETDLKNTPESEYGRRVLLAENARKGRQKLDMIDRSQVLIILIIISLAIYILEQATIGLTSLALIAFGSVLVGSGVHLGKLKLKEVESTKEVNK